MRDAAGRILWGFVTAAWPGVLALREEFRMHWWHCGLTWAIALAEAGCAVALRVHQSRARKRADRERQHDAEARLRALEEWRDVHEERAGAYVRALTVMADYGRVDFPELRPGPARLSVVPPQGRGA